MENDLAERLGFRPISAADMDFLQRVYASTRQEEMAQTGWSQEQIEEFLHMQFWAQHQHYQRFYKNASYEIILLDQTPVGRLYSDRREDEIRIIDIALLPEYQKRGIGAKILKDLLAEGEQKNLCVQLHVENFNPALHLYERLGFRRIADDGVYVSMEWTPPRIGIVGIQKK